MAGKFPPWAKGWLAGLLVLAWLLPGLVGHDPWKPDEAYSMGLIYHILETGDWVVPTLGGEPFMEKPPLYYLTAAGVARGLAPFLPLHDGARLTSGLFMGVVFLCIVLTGRELYGRGNGCVALLLLMGCLGLLPHAHQMITDTALLAGFALALYGLALSRRRPALGGGWLGLGAGMGFLAKGLLAPLVLGGVVCLLLFFPAWRNRRFFASLGVALLVALPWLTIWPSLLHQRHPELFDVWFWENNYGRFFGSSGLATRQEPGYYLKALTWFTGPALPLALLTLWRYRGQASKTARTEPGAPLQLPLVMAGVILATLFASAATRTLYILPLLLPVALLATPAVTDSVLPLPRFWRTLLITLFSGLALLAWVVWLLALCHTVSAGEWDIGGWSESFVMPEGGMPFRGVDFGLALCASGVWLGSIRHMGQSARHLLAGWTGGVTLIWLLSMTLWLPVIDYGKSYRTVVAQIQQSLPTPYTCIASRGLGEPQRAMLHYFGHILTQRVERDRSAPVCDVLLVQISLEKPREPLAKGQILWQGGRPGDTKEWYILQRLPIDQ
ncbi:MAG: glycosyltransferase family 39 protein [Magnetococcales bacterium]|nr:glycosyltransferase family 39 protein [Magnetococcales bacterium]